LREFITEGLTKKGAVYKYDISIPIHLMYEIVEIFRKRLENTSLEVFGFGHMGDSNVSQSF
jgi:D-2-hydroxyglutarate dehydrogenase